MVKFSTAKNVWKVVLLLTNLIALGYFYWINCVQACCHWHRKGLSHFFHSVSHYWVFAMWITLWTTGSYSAAVETKLDGPRTYLISCRLVTLLSWLLDDIITVISHFFKKTSSFQGTDFKAINWVGQGHTTLMDLTAPVLGALHSELWESNLSYKKWKSVTMPSIWALLPSWSSIALMYVQ